MKCITLFDTYKTNTRYFNGLTTDTRYNGFYINSCIQYLEAIAIHNSVAIVLKQPSSILANVHGTIK